MQTSLTVGTQQRLAILPGQMRVTMDGIGLQEGENQSELLLGCQIRSKLKWSLHIKYLQRKLKGRMTGLSAIKYAVPFENPEYHHYRHVQQCPWLLFTTIWWVQCK